MVPALPVRRDWILALICYLSFPTGKEALSRRDAGKVSSLLAVLPFFPAPGLDRSLWVHLPCLSGSPPGQEMPASLQPWSIWSAGAQQLLVSSWLSWHKENSSIQLGVHWYVEVEVQDFRAKLLSSWSVWTMLLSDLLCSLCLNSLFTVNSGVEMSFITYVQRGLNLSWGLSTFQYQKFLPTTLILPYEILGNHYRKIQQPQAIPSLSSGSEQGLGHRLIVVVKEL